METRSIKIWAFAAISVLAMAVSGFGNFARAADASPSQTPTPLTTNLAKAADTAVDVTKNAAKTTADTAKKSVRTTFQEIRDFPLTTTRDASGNETHITFGNAVCALLFIFLGYLVSRFIGARIERISVHHFHIPKENAKILRKGSAVFLFAIIAFQVLNIYNISLTVFAFLGGALAVGLGFGAREIMSNFISGVILIFEKPMRVGDVVEINNVNGTVKKIGLRATLIQRGDGVDVLIPNRYFLENVLANQTHSKRPMRCSFDIGATYGTSIESAKSLLLKKIENHESILKKPAPQVVVSAFGQYAIVFTLHYWIELGIGIDAGAVASDLRIKIDSVFAEHEIEMKCPW